MQKLKPFLSKGSVCMRDTSTTKLSKMGRRRFLDTLGKLGVSAGALSYMSAEALADVTADPSDEVPRLDKLKHTNHEAIKRGEESPEKEAVYYTIPRDEWVVVETAHDAAERLEAAFEQQIATAVGGTLEDPTSNLKFGVTTVTSGQTRQKAVVVEYRRLTARDGTVVGEPHVDFEWVRDRAPETVSGSVGSGDKQETRSDIPVVVRQRTVEQQAYYDGKYRPVPGGCQIEDAYDDDIGTLCTPSWDDDNGEYVLVTAGHITEGETDHPTHQPYQSQYYDYYIGYSDKGYAASDFDAATIRLASDVDYYYWMAGSDAGTYSESIYGTLGWDTIKDHEEDTGYHLSLQGRTTGRNSGHIEVTYSDKTFWIDVDSDGGDSGGTHFREDPKYNYAYIAGVHAWGSSANDAGATYIGKVENYLNLDV
jgi:hypothetical protein